MTLEPRSFLRELFETAVAAVAAEACVPPHLPRPPRGRTVVVAAGKAAAAMAAAAERHWAGPLDRLSGIAVTRYGHAVPCARVEVVEAAHPVPDAAGAAVAERALALAGRLGEDDLLLCLLSGGGSALLSLPAPGLSLDDVRTTTDLLLRSGAAIRDINAVRRHLSAIAGGRLALAAAPARVVTLAISDVVGDDPVAIASGPTAPDPTTCGDALAVLERYDPAPGAVLRHLRAEGAETPKPGDPLLASAGYVIVARAADALARAAARARAQGVTPVSAGDDLEGEARVVARHHARLALALSTGDLSVALPPPIFEEPGGNGRGTHTPRASADEPPPEPPLVLLSGGETTVTVRGNGRGGPNTEFLLSLAANLGGAERIWALAADTDGSDGSEDNAGAVVTPDTLRRARDLGLDPHHHLAGNDSYRFFAALGDLVESGPTLTNVNDFRAIVLA